MLREQLLADVHSVCALEARAKEDGDQLGRAQRVWAVFGQALARALGGGLVLDAPERGGGDGGGLIRNAGGRRHAQACKPPPGG
jgi:hypothetical protein